MTFVTVRRSYASDLGDGDRLFVVKDATRWNKLGLAVLAAQLAWILLWTRPHVVITTGAAPGYLALLLGKTMRARTVWIDSVANMEELSLSGKKAGRIADLWLTQWPHLASDGGPSYRGAVL